MPYQDNWHYCQDYHVIFFAGYGGGSAQVWVATTNRASTPSYCAECRVLPMRKKTGATANCLALFFNGYDDKGRWPGVLPTLRKGCMSLTLPHSRRSGPKA
jgi:hypothetical protein